MCHSYIYRSCFPQNHVEILMSLWGFWNWGQNRDEFITAATLASPFSRFLQTCLPMTSIPAAFSHTQKHRCCADLREFSLSRREQMISSLIPALPWYPFPQDHVPLTTLGNTWSALCEDCVPQLGNCDPEKVGNLGVISICLVGFFFPIPFSSNH